MTATPVVPVAAPEDEELALLVSGAHHDPHAVLGAHHHPDGMVVRAVRPLANGVDVLLADGQRFPLARIHPDGVFSGLVPGEFRDYRLAVRYTWREEIVDDGYRWLPTLTDDDLWLFGEGQHERLWSALGARRLRYDSAFGQVEGVSFAVWAPTARGVRVHGDFNGWDDREHPMRSLGASGVWEVFVPGVADGARYKFRLLAEDGEWHERADPLAFATELPPATASVVHSARYRWGDGDWLANRATTDWQAQPISVYEVHLGSWRKGLGYRELAKQLTEYVVGMGYTHVELLPVAEHPFGGSWGYQVSSYYAPTARYGSPDDFRFLVDSLHRAGIGVILDWVPAHFPRDEWALGRFDGTPLYEHPDPQRGEHPDWGTYVFNYGRNEVRAFLVSSAMFWLTEFHVDGLRVDAVASMLYLDYSRPYGAWQPNVHGGRENLEAIAFLTQLTETVRRSQPGALVIAEESTAWPGVTALDGLGFDFKWNMGWMHDTLDYVRRDPVYRGHHQDEVTFSLVYAWSEHFVLPLSHDEVVHGKGTLWSRMPGDDWNKAAGVRALLGYMWAHPGKQLLFMGGEFGQPTEWSADDGLPWQLVEQFGGVNFHRGIQRMVAAMNRAYRATPALYSQDSVPAGFGWIAGDDAAGNVLAFLRWGTDGSVLACLVNFAGVPHTEYRIGLPVAGRWHEVLNTDDVDFGGSGVGNAGGVQTQDEPRHGQPVSAVVSLPPSGVLWLAPDQA